MTNPYYNGPSGITPFTRARAEDITANFMAIAAGFDLMQTGGSAESPQYSGTVTAGAFTTTGIMTAGSGIFSTAAGAPVFLASSTGNGRAALIAGTPTVSGYVNFQTSGGTQIGYIGQIASGGAINYVSQNGGGHSFIGGTLSATAIQVAGNSVWHAGNLNPGAYAALSGANFSGAISIAGGITSYSDIVAAGGDITAYRAGGSTGAIYLNSAKTRYIFNDGTNLQIQISGGNVSVNGSGVWHSGNLTPGDYMAKAGGTFGGRVNFGDGSTFVEGASRQIQIDSGIAIRSEGGKCVIYVGGSAVFSVGPDGATRQSGPALWRQGSV